MKNKLKINATVRAVLGKYYQPENLPKVFTDIGRKYQQLEDARNTLNDSDLSDNQKLAQYADLCQEVHNMLKVSLEHYRADIKQKKAEFEVNVAGMYKPVDSAESIRHSTLLGYILTLDKSEIRQMVKSDGEIARVVLQIPDSLKAKKGIEGDMVQLLKESIFPGYLQELDKYDSLLETVGRQEKSLHTDLASVYNSPQANVAKKQATDLNRLASMNKEN